MERDFVIPKTKTRDERGVVALDYSFQLHAECDARKVSKTPRGGRVYRAITGGKIEGPRLNGAVYPHSGGDYGVIRASDGVEDIAARFMVRATNGEWIYIQHVGYRRPDGYHVVQALFDADATGPYAWLNDAIMLANVVESDGGKRAIYSYYQAI